jgi:hypothetical protein|tara:strand:+ start:406 stop:648 length:243 start_codon:yes stop_codon:yes gene_type:complete
MKFKFKPEKVAFVYVENITFAVVMKDDKGDDILINEEGIELDSQLKAELSDQVLAHIREGKAVEEIDEEVITFQLEGGDK